MRLTGKVAVAIGTLVLVTACGDKKADDNAMADSTAMAMSAEPVAPAMTDANMMYSFDQAMMADSAMGMMASMKGTNQDVKDFGKTMMNDHHDLHVASMDLSTKLGVTPAMMAGDQSDAMMMEEKTKMESMEKGAAWDKAFIDYEVTHHQESIDKTRSMMGMTQNQEVKDLMNKAVDGMQKHLDRAKELQTKMSTM